MLTDKIIYLGNVVEISFVKVSRYFSGFLVGARK